MSTVPAAAAPPPKPPAAPPPPPKPKAEAAAKPEAKPEAIKPEAAPAKVEAPKDPKAPEPDAIDRALEQAGAVVAARAEAAPPKPEGAPAATLEDLAKIVETSEDPVFKADHKGLPPTADILAVLPEPGRKLVANILRDYTQKRQADSEAARLAKTEADQVRAELAQVRGELAALNSPEFLENLQAIKAKGEKADRFTVEGQEAIAEARAAALFERMLRPVQERLEIQARKAAIDAFVAQNPDIKTPEIRDAVVKLLKAPGNDAMSLETAYRLVTGQRAIEERDRLRAERETDTEARRRTVEITAGGGHGPSEQAPKHFKKATDALDYFMSQGMK